MQHLDEGVIHALLDGELTGSESDAVRDHVQLCPDCADRLAEERLIQSEAERMIAELDTPDAAPEPAMPPRTEEFPGIAMAPGEPRSSGTPVVLMPERDFERSRLPRLFGWAATLLVAAGAGYFASVARQGPPAGVNAGTLPELEPQVSAPVPAAGVGADSGAATRPATPSFDSTVAGGSSAEFGAGAAAEMDSAPLIVEESESEREPPVVVPPPAPQRQPAAAARSTVARDRAAERQDSLARAEERADAEAEAAKANAAPRAAAPAEAAAAAARPPRTELEQRAQIRMRLGLDEISRMLGGPLHVIDGLQPQLVGLVDGQLVQGADPNASVVRVVYLDQARRPIYLDQQRVALARRQMGAARDTIPPDWVKGDVWLSLKGDLSAEELSALARRVR